MTGINEITIDSGLSITLTPPNFFREAVDLFPDKVITVINPQLQETDSGFSYIPSKGVEVIICE